jgi:hypothetical protein
VEPRHGGAGRRPHAPHRADPHGDGVRLIAKGTIEEKELALSARKAALFAGVMNDGNAFGSALGADDIRALVS